MPDVPPPAAICGRTSLYPELDEINESEVIVMKIRKLLCITAVLIFVLALTGCGKSAEKNAAEEGEPLSREVYAMDTYMTLSAYGDNAEKALDESEKEIKRIDAMLSTGNSESEISRLNKAGKLKVSDETFELIRRAKEIGETAQGVFDISIYPVMREWGFTDKNYKVPADEALKAALEKVDASKIKLDEETKTVSFAEDGVEIDLGGIAKGYTSDRVIDIMKECGVEHALINLGGNVKVLSNKPDGSDWRVAIIDPENEEQYIGGVEVKDKAVITSGGYQRYFEEDGKRYFHIIDISDGYPADNGLISTTIVSEDGTLADALSTTLFIMGPDKAANYWRKHKDEFDAVLVKDDGTVLVTEGIENDYFTDGKYEVIR